MDVSELGEEAWAAALHPARWPAALLGTLARLSRLFVPRVLCMRTHRGASPQELGVPRSPCLPAPGWKGSQCWL